MKRIIKIPLVLFCVALPTVFACSQPPAPPAGPPVAGPVRPAGPGRMQPPPPPSPGGPDGPGGRGVRELFTLQGSIRAYTASDSNVYDGLTLQNSGQTSAIRFAPHLGESLMAAAKTGSSISIQGYYETTPEGMNVVRLVNATAGGQTIYDGPPPAATNPPAESTQSFNGTITDLRRDRQGTPNGILLSGGRVIDLPPGVYDQLQAYLRSGMAISGSGSRVSPAPGVVLAQNIQSIHPQTLTVNGQTYMVR